MKINNKIEEGEKVIDDFVESLIERNKVPENEQEAERERLKKMISERIMDEALEALPDDDLEEIEETLNRGEEPTFDRWNSMLFMAGIRPESIKEKVFRDIEREYLGIENVESDESLIEVEEGV